MSTKRYYSFGSFRLDPDTRVLLRDGDVVPLPPKAIDTLLVLIEKAGEPIEKEALMRAVWPDTFVEENNLAHNISVLRKTLGDVPGSRPFIETIPKRGYRFAGDVTEVAANGGSAGVPPTPEEQPAAPGRLRLIRRAALAIAPLLAIGAAAWWVRHNFSSAPRIHSLAVLPLQNLSGDPQQEYVTDGITEALTTELAKIGALRVISRTSAARYRETTKALPEIARELGVEAVVEGSVARFGDRVRISAQLVEAGSDRHLWTETYERDLGEVSTLWSDVASAIARQIRIAVTPEERARLVGRPVNREAFEAYLRGRHCWNKRTPDNIRKAIEYFRKAIDEEPAYARAYAGLADCYNQLGTVLIGGQPPTEVRPLAIAAAKEALEVDPELAEAEAALAYARLYDWEWAQAEQGFHRAIHLNPSYASAHLWYSHYLSMRKRPEEALREVKLAQQLDPLSLIIQTQVGWVLQHAGRFDEAIQQLQKVLETDPNYLWALWRIGSSYADAGRYEEGIQALEKAATLSGRSPAVLGTLAETYGLAGRKVEARKLLQELIEISGRSYVPAIAFVHACVGVKDTERIFEWLEKAYQQRENGIAYLAVWKDHGPYRSDPRFRDLIRRVGLPQ